MLHFYYTTTMLFPMLVTYYRKSDHHQTSEYSISSTEGSGPQSWMHPIQGSVKKKVSQKSASFFLRIAVFQR